MKEKITLKILAEDIKNSRYLDHDNCAITKAVQRATNNPLIHDMGECIGIGIYDSNQFKTPIKLSIKVCKMYEGKIKPADFDFELKIPSSYILSLV